MAFDWKHITPLTGLLDNRSTPDQIQPGSWAYRMNFTGPERGMISRMHGWRPPFYVSDSTYVNADLHDQLIAADAGNPVREPINFLREVRSTVGDRVLIAGTKNRIYRLNGQTQNWQLLHKGLGSGSITNSAWQVAQVLDTVIFSNNYGTPKSWTIGKSPNATTINGVLEEIYSLGKNGINLTRAGAVYAWKGFIFFGDVVMDGARQEYRVLWSDLNKPLSFSPKSESSIAGYQDLSFGERVLAFMELSDYLLIYTTKAIWQVTIVASQELFNFRRAYPDPQGGQSCLFYRNTLFSTGDSHYYCGKDNVYRYNLGLSKPEPVEWISKAVKTMFDEIQPTLCESTVGGYFTGKQQAIISYPSSAADSGPDKSIVLDFKSETTHELDHGFTAFCSYAPDEKMTLRDFMVEGCICTLNQLQDQNQEWYWEGLPRVDVTNLCHKTPNSFIAGVGDEDKLNIEYLGETLVIEDYTRTNDPDPLSLCSLFAEIGWNRFEDLCHDCDVIPIDLAASAQDYCIKELTDQVYSRYTCSSGQANSITVNKGIWTAIASYSSSGYFSVLTSGPIKIDKVLRGIEVDIDIDGESAQPPELQLSVGCSSQPSSPVNGIFPIVWRDQVINKRYIKNQTSFTAAQLAAQNLKPNGSLFWPLHITGPYIYLKFTVRNSDGTAPTAGAFRFTRISLGF